MSKANSERKRAGIIILSSVSCFLIGVIIFGFIFSFGNFKIGEAKIEKKPTQNFIMDTYGSETMSLAMVSQTNSLTEEYLVTATVTPTEAANKKVDWSVEFENGNNEWASGKNANLFVSVVPVAEDGAQAKVSCLQAFGSRIKVVAKSNDNPNVSAYCLCEYYERVTNVNGNITGIGDFNTNTAVCEWTYTKNGLISGTTGDYALTSLTASIFTEKSVCTINDSFHHVEVTVTPTKDFERAMRAKYSSYECDSVSFTVNNGSVSSEMPANYGSGCYFPLTGLINLSDGIMADPIERILIEEAYLDVLRENANMCFMSVSITVTGEHNTFTKTFQMKAKQSSLPVKVSNVSLDKSTLHF